MDKGKKSRQELTIVLPGYIKFHEKSELVLNKSLKSLVIENLHTITSNDEMELDVFNYSDRHTTEKIVSDMSLRLPQLENLHLHSVYGKFYEKLPFICHIHRSANFIWSRSLPSTANLESIQEEENWNIHIQITKSDTGEESFYTDFFL